MDPLKKQQQQVDATALWLGAPGVTGVSAHSTDGWGFCSHVPVYCETLGKSLNKSRVSSSVRWETKTICCLCRIQERENWLSFCSSVCFMTLKERLQRRPVTFILVMEGTTYICLSSQIGWDNKILLEESSTAIRTIFYVKWQVTLVIGWAEKKRNSVPIFFSTWFQTLLIRLNHWFAFYFSKNGKGKKVNRNSGINQFISTYKRRNKMKASQTETRTSVQASNSLKIYRNILEKLLSEINQMVQ